MKYLKVQQDLLKIAVARDDWKHRPFNCPWFQYKGKVWVCFDAVICLGIPHGQFYLDREQVFKDAVPFDGGKNIIDMNTDTMEALDTKTVRDVVINRKKMKLHEFTVGDATVHINDELLNKYFELEISRFTGTKRNSPIYVWEGDDLVGVVFPVNYNSINERGNEE